MCVLSAFFYYHADIISRISSTPPNGTVGNSQEITCLIITTSLLDPSSVTGLWTGPSGIVTSNDRMITNATVDDNIYFMVLYFDHLLESNEGVYTCNVTTSDHTVSLSTNLTKFLSKYLNVPMQIVS